MSKKKHQHHGKSTKDLLDPQKILRIMDLEPGHIMLDAGCGDGYISLAAAKYVGEAGKIYALDEYEPSLKKLEEEAKKKGFKNIYTLLADLTDHIPLEDNKVDRCVMANVFHGFQDKITQRNVLLELMRILKPGGTLAVVEFKKKQGPPGPSYEVRLSITQMIRILEYHYFKVLKRDEIGPYHYLVLGEKPKK